MFVIVGAGFSGLGMAIKLKQSGREDFVILERAADLGGTWRDNDYPGCACDIPSHVYSYSFELNPEWTRAYPGWAEIHSYLRRTAEKYGVAEHIRYRHEVTDAIWDEGTSQWRVTAETPAGIEELTGEHLVLAPGGLSEPLIPKLPGLEKFQGKTFHSARWDHQHDLTGKRVAVVGTGASAIQFVPQIQPDAERLILFQRTPPWVMPRFDRRFGRAERWVLSNLPGATRALRGAIFYIQEARAIGFRRPRLMQVIDRVARLHLRRQVRDPELRRRLTPEYVMGCKRILVSDDYYPAVQKPNVELVTEAVSEVRAHSVVDSAGTEHSVDTIIFGTGFRVTDQPIATRVRGKDGRTLAEHWSGGMSAHKGTAIAGFPNLFFLLGPNTGLGHNSMIYILESQLYYVFESLREYAAREAASFEVREGAQRAYNSEVEDMLSGTVWVSGGCDSWYLDASGRNTVNWPGSAIAFRRALREFDPVAYEYRAAAASDPVVATAEPIRSSTTGGTE